MKKYSISEFRNYLIQQISLKHAIANLSVEEMDKASWENMNNIEKRDYLLEETNKIVNEVEEDNHEKEMEYDYFQQQERLLSTEGDED